MKKAVIFLVVLLLLGGGYYLIKPKSAQIPIQDDLTRTEIVEKGMIQDMVSTTGKVIPNREIAIKCKASGTIVNAPFLANDRIKKGDLLLGLDPIDEERNVKQAEIDLSSSEAKLVEAKQNLKVQEETVQVAKDRAVAGVKSAEAKNKDEKAKAERMQELLKKKLVSQEEYDTAATSAVQSEVNLENAKIQLDEVKIQEMQIGIKRESVKLAEAEVEQDKIALTIAQRRLNETKVYAPVDAVISDTTAQIGKIISSGITNVGGGTTVMTLCDLSQIFLQATVDESDVGRLKVDQIAKIAVSAYPRKEFTGKIITIATKGRNVSNVVTFEVKIEVLSENKILLKPEMTSTIDIVISNKDNAIIVPSEAITMTDLAAGYVIMKDQENKPIKHPVRIGLANTKMTEIIEGLAEGDIITVTNTGRRMEPRRFGPPPM